MEGDKVLIPIRVDASGVQPGVNETVDGLKQIEAQTIENQETSEVSSARFDASVLTNRRSVMHLLEGLMELQRGGTAAIGGLASEGFVATEAFEAMLGPLGPLLMAVTLITSLAIPMVERFSEHNDKLEEGKQKEEDFGAAAKSAGEAAKTSIEVATDSLRSYLEVQKEIIEGEKKRAEFERQRLEDLEKQHAASTKLHIAELDLQKQKELSEAKSDTQRDAIEARYKAQEARIKGASTDEKYKLDDEAMESQRKSNQEELEIHYGQNDDADTRLKTLQDRARSTAGNVDVQPDEKGSYEAAIKEQVRIANEAEKDYLAAQGKSSPDGKEVQIKQGEFTEENVKLVNLRDAQKAYEELAKEGPNIRKAIESSEKRVLDLLNENDRLSRQEETLGINYKTTKATEAATSIKDDSESKRKKIEDDAKDAASALEKKRLDTQAQLDLAMDAAQKEKLQRQLDDIERQKLEAEKQTKIAKGEIAPGSNQAQVYDAMANEKSAKSKAEIEKEENKTGDKELTRIISETSAAIKDSKHPELEQELKNLVTAAKNDPQGKILGLLQVLSQTVAASHGQNTAWLTAMEKELHDLQAQVARQSHP